MTWQVNWRRWQMPWWHVSIEFCPIACNQRHYYRDNFAGVGPFQFHWHSRHDSRRRIWKINT